MSEEAQLRIGELARRTGVATELLRAWERRYRLLSPTLTDGGYRLYSTGDVRRILRCPADTLTETVRRLVPEALVLAIADRALLPGVAATVESLAGATTVWLGGAGAVALAGVRLLEGSAVEAASGVAAA